MTDDWTRNSVKLIRRVRASGRRESSTLQPVESRTNDSPRRPYFQPRRVAAQRPGFLFRRRQHVESQVDQLKALRTWPKLLHDYRPICRLYHRWCRPDRYRSCRALCLRAHQRWRRRHPRIDRIPSTLRTAITRAPRSFSRPLATRQLANRVCQDCAGRVRTSLGDSQAVTLTSRHHSPAAQRPRFDSVDSVRYRTDGPAGRAKSPITTRQCIPTVE